MTETTSSITTDAAVRGERASVRSIASAPSARRRRHRTVVLAALVSAAAVVVALTAHLAFGVGERPIVIGTLLIASFIGWANAESTSGGDVAHLHGRSTGRRHARAA